MKKLYFILSFLSITSLASAQWTEVSIGNTTAPVSVLFSNNLVSGDESVVVGTAGDGIFRSTNNGGDWTDVSGNIGNKSINFLDGAETIYFVGTQDGAFLTVDLLDYMDNTGSGLPSSDVTFYGIGSSIAGDHIYAISTRGGGLFTSENINGPWLSANSGISGDGLFINSLRGYYDPETVTYNVLATNGGVYFSMDGLNSWTQKNNGLTGDALIVTEAYALGSATVIATHAGLYYSLDFGDNWINLIPDVKINKFLMSNRIEGPAFFIFGESNMVSVDLLTWNPVLMDGYSGGEVAFAAVNSEYIFIAPDASSRNENSGAILYKAPYNMVVGVDENHVQTTAELRQNAPNPFGHKTEISYNLKTNGLVNISVYDLRGQKVADLINDYRTKGTYSCTFSADQLPEGIYFYQLSIENQIIDTKKMVVARK